MSWLTDIAKRIASPTGGQNIMPISKAEPVFYREAKESAAAPAIVATTVGQPVWTDRRYDQFALEGFSRNAIAFRCISMVAQAASFVNLLLMDTKTKKEIEKHPLLDLINRPSPVCSGSELIDGTLSFLQIAGNAYIESVGPDGKPPKELYYLRPDRMKVISGRTALAAGYEYEANGRTIRWQVDPITGMGPILHLKKFNPLNDWYGLSALEPAAYAVDLHNEAGAHNMALLQNGAVPSGALVLKPVTANGQMISAPPEIITAAEKRLAEQHGGASKAGKPFVLGGNVEWEAFGQSLEDLQLTESKLEAAREICTSFGVPHILFIPGASTYNNVREAKLDLYEATVLPTLEWLLDHLNFWLVPLFGENLKLVADYDSVDALSLRREEKRKTYIELHKEKIVTRSEVREALNFDELEGLSDFAPQAHEVTAIVTLVNGNKLSKETGWETLQGWGLLPEDFDPEAEQARLDEQAENDMANGLMGLESDEEDEAMGEDGKPLPPGTKKPENKPPAPKPPAPPIPPKA